LFVLGFDDETGENEQAKEVEEDDDVANN